MMTLDRAAIGGEGGGFTTSAKMKLDELFVTWLSYDDTYHFISSVISSFKLSPTSPTSPLDSPVLDGSVVSPRKYSPRKYNRSYTRTSPEGSQKTTNNEDIHHDHSPTSPPPSAPSPSSAPSSHPSLKMQDTYHSVPRFYFPSQQPFPALVEDDVALPKLSSHFSSARILSLQDAISALESTATGLPKVVSRYILEREADRFTEESMLKFDVIDISGRDAAAVIFEVLRQPNATSLQTSDFKPFLRLILDTHPGLAFLNNTPEFQERYLETILVRIFYNTPRGISGKMDLCQLRKSGLVGALTFIDNENDINKSIDFFSYEHFYVIYCKFWEVDTDHDLIISAEDLMRYSGGAPTRRVAERIASTPIFPREADLARVLASKQRRQRNKKSGLMTYQDFVWYILSEEDRDSTTSMEYWFRILDLDEDGYWSSFELEYFYLDMMPHLRDLGMDPPPFEDLLCQWLDMLSPHHARSTTAWDCPRVNITIADLRKCKLGKSIIHSLVSPAKFLAHETKDPFAEPRDGVSDWVRFALIEYELAVADQAEQQNFQDET